MSMSFKVLKNRKNTGQSTMFTLTPISQETMDEVVKKTRYLDICNFKQANISNIFSDFYDSVPAVNTDSSLPISFNNITSTFPNTRYSFYMYNSVAPMIGDKIHYEDPYYNELELSPFPYGYEHEECFINHTKTYGRGTSHLMHVKETSKVIKMVPRKIIISYIKSSNTYIVRSVFLDEEDSLYRSFSFFKQNEKLLYKKQTYISWNASIKLPDPFAQRIRNYLKQNNSLLYQAIEVAPQTVCQYRTVLNNPFWRRTSSTYLLNSANKKLRVSAQKSFKKNKFNDPISKYNLPKTFENVLRDSFMDLSRISIATKLYTQLEKQFGSEIAASHIKDILSLDQGKYNLNLISDFIDNLIQLNAVDFKESNFKTVNVLLTLFREYPQVSLTGCTSTKEYLFKVSSNFKTRFLTLKKIQFDINGKTAIISPSVLDVIQNHIDTKFYYYNPSNILTLFSSSVIFDGKPMTNVTRIADSLSFSELLSNADVLVANKIITKKPEYKECEPSTTVAEDFF